MKKILIILAIVFLIVVLGIWWYGKNNKAEENNGSNYQAEKSIATNNINTDNINNSNKINTNITQNQINTNTNTNTNTSNITEPVQPKTETQIAVFTTKIYGNEASRQNNMQITCNTLNNVEVQPGETFSFCNTVGKATAEKGYQEADIFVDGEKKKGFGGGNCQISTTIYNAVAQIPELEVIERHNHSRDVKYIEKGKDAAVAYGSYDFKFKNNTDGVIRIVMEKTEKNITAKLIKIS